MPDFSYESKYGDKLVCGLDEVGRGSLAGPLVTAGVILPPDAHLPEINDSKQIRKSEHQRLVQEIFDKAIEVRIDITPASVVDYLGINPALKESMTTVVESFTNKPDVLLIDGSEWQKLDIDMEQETIVKGDTKSLSIACASLVAKFLHDTWMLNVTKQYPEYDFENNTGYGTKKHLEAIAQYGVTNIHRRTFKPISTNKYKNYRGGAT